MLHKRQDIRLKPRDMPERFAPAEIERAENIGARKGAHGCGGKLCPAHEILRREERPALPPRRNQPFGVRFAEAGNQAQAKAQCMAVAGEAPLTLSLSPVGRGDA